MRHTSVDGEDYMSDVCMADARAWKGSAVPRGSHMPRLLAHKSLVHGLLHGSISCALTPAPPERASAGSW